MNPHDRLQQLKDAQKIPERFIAILDECIEIFRSAAIEKIPSEEVDNLFNSYLTLIAENIESPYQFSPYHSKITAPFDYEKFGLEFMRPLLIFQESTLQGEKNLEEIVKATSAGENVILLANHQTEPDPQIIHLMLEKTAPHLGSEMIFVAGSRVTTDPMAIPFSMGRNLLCIYSKKHIENPPEKKAEKLAHNHRTMKRMAELLSEGGKCIYVAPSGGRDRVDDKGHLEPAPFDASSVEMLYLTGERSARKTHFYPLALKTFDILPPPSSLIKELGEKRSASRAAVHLSFGENIEMQSFPGLDHPDKKERRKIRADEIWKQVTKLYQKLP